MQDSPGNGSGRPRTRGSGRTRCPKAAPGGDEDHIPRRHSPVAGTAGGGKAGRGRYKPSPSPEAPAEDDHGRTEPRRMSTSATPRRHRPACTRKDLKPQTRAFIGGRFDDSLAERGYDCVSPIDGKRDRVARRRRSSVASTRRSRRREALRLQASGRTWRRARKKILAQARRARRTAPRRARTARHALHGRADLRSPNGYVHAMGDQRARVVWRGDRQALRRDRADRQVGARD